MVTAAPDEDDPAGVCGIDLETGAPTTCPACDWPLASSAHVDSCGASTERRD